jgi:bifunctional enzyme CysN/CysC
VSPTRHDKIKAGREKMDIVIVGHVDHGKSTVIGRLLADTNSLPEGKLEAIQERCRRESKQFEYAFLLDALKDEQSQGITIDSARCFFNTKKRDYTIIDAPGHIEFLKNMISGAARAEAAVLVIDAKEGVRENSKRHGYMLSMLGIKQIIVCINKMDLVDYDEKTYEKIKKEYTQFLKEIGVLAKKFIPVSALAGENIAISSEKMAWFKGDTILSSLDSFEKEKDLSEKPFRMPVQQVYKFTRDGDSRRIIAGRVVSGKIKPGEPVVFLPSNKRTKIKSIEGFNESEGMLKEKHEGQSTGFTLEEEIYVNRGDIMCREEDKLPNVSTMMKVSIFWMAKSPLVMDKEYKIKLGTASSLFKVKEITKVLDASNLKNEKKEKVDRHEVAEVILQLRNAMAFDTSIDIQDTSRFVIVDDYEISGGGIITEPIQDNLDNIREKVFEREKKWYKGEITQMERALRYGQKPQFILITGKTGLDKKSIAMEIEKRLFSEGRKVYYLGIGNILRGLGADITKEKKDEHLRRLSEVSHILLDAGLIVITTASDLSLDDIKKIREITTSKDVTIANLGTGIDPNGTVDILLDEKENPDQNAEIIINHLRYNNYIYGV